ncbi:hypothetical protein BVRB_3g048430 [Beta vulgaris subsp. vulgaris]|nr:hypothetical protein BVRB_3g048430 [Beta vulgaris subsp. vulgaris]
MEINLEISTSPPQLHRRSEPKRTAWVDQSQKLHSLITKSINRMFNIPPQTCILAVLAPSLQSSSTSPVQHKGKYREKRLCHCQTFNYHYVISIHYIISIHYELINPTCLQLPSLPVREA